MGVIHPDWPAPSNVRAVFTTRENGFSSGIYQGLNLGSHVGDAADVVELNRRQLQQQLGLHASPLWLTQVHGTDIFIAEEAQFESPVADAAVTHTPELALTVMTADCLPVLFCNKAGTVVATAHAGWRGLCAGVLEKTIGAMKVAPEDILAWIGPAIGLHDFKWAVKSKQHLWILLQKQNRRLNRRVINGWLICLCWPVNASAHPVLLTFMAEIPALSAIRNGFIPIGEMDRQDAWLV